MRRRGFGEVASSLSSCHLTAVHELGSHINENSSFFIHILYCELPHVSYGAATFRNMCGLAVMPLGVYKTCCNPFRCPAISNPCGAQASSIPRVCSSHAALCSRPRVVSLLDCLTSSPGLAAVSISSQATTRGKCTACVTNYSTITRAGSSNTLTHASNY